jgi:hypothetical protein
MRYSAAELAENPAFLGVVRGLARMLRGAFEDNPRIARLLSAHQKWLLSQAGMALYLEGHPDGLTAARLRDLVTPNGIASRNTVQNFLDQLETYRYIEQVSVAGSYRPRRYAATKVSLEALYNWYVANLAAIDQLDNGGRAQDMMANPQLFNLAQPRAARACLDQPDWREPPERVALFLWTEAGALVMDEFIARIDDAVSWNERIDIGHVDARAIAKDFMMSRTHLQRLINKSVEQGSLGWNDESAKAGMWFSREFLQEYCTWQAIKFAHVNDAFLWAREELASQGEVSTNG